MEVVDHQQQRRAVGEGRVDVVEETESGTRVVGRAGSQRLGGVGLGERLGEGLERGERLLGTAAEQDRGAARQCRGGELVGEAGLADAGFAGEQDQTPVAVHLHARPRRAQALELGAAADELGPVRALERARSRNRCGEGPAQVVEQRAGLAGRWDAERAAQPFGEALAGGERGGSVAGAREPLDQAPVRFLGEWVERDLLTRQTDRGRRVGRPGGQLLERLGEPLSVRLARIVGPLVLEAVEDRCAARLQSPSRVAGVERRLERPRVDGEAGAVERDGLA